MLKNERELTAWFRRYLKTVNPVFMSQSCAIEFKFVKGNRLNFKSHFKPQQIPALLQAKYSCYYDKISDMSAGIKPFDSFNVCGGAYVVVAFSKTQEIFALDIEIIQKELKNGAKSIDAKKCREYGIVL